jgi:hypothetical protein
MYISPKGVIVKHTNVREIQLNVSITPLHLAPVSQSVVESMMAKVR